MKAQSKPSSLVWLLVLSSLYLLSTGCSRAPLGTAPTADSSTQNSEIPSSTGNALTYCSGSVSADSSLAASATIYLDNQGGYVGDHIRAKITTLPSSFGNSGMKLKFFRWKVSSDGTPYLDNAPMVFGVQRSDGYVSGGERTELAGTELTAVTGSGDIANFTSNYHFIIRGATNDWEVLKIVIYSGSSVYNSLDVLMPAFTANPTTYAANNPALLSSLHPGNSMGSGNWTDNDYLSMLDKYCFFNVGNI